MTAADDIETRVSAYQQRIEGVLERALPPASQSPERLHAAQRYSVLGGGKRLRPLLVYFTGTALGSSLEALDAPAAAVELIHAYSLVHDDLPAMDNDDLRRGRPTVHRAFDEATAILAGDALQVLAFALLAAEGPTGSADSRLRMIQCLAAASGTAGMAGGQALDLAAVGRRLTVPELEAMHRLKTGALIRASVLIGACPVADLSESTWQALSAYAADLGLAFQIQDDILDVEGDVAALGKLVGADAARAKPTFPSILGLAGAKQRAQELTTSACGHLAALGGQGEPLRWLARFVVSRRS